MRTRILVAAVICLSACASGTQQPVPAPAPPAILTLSNSTYTAGDHINARITVADSYGRTVKHDICAKELEREVEPGEWRVVAYPACSRPGPIRSWTLNAGATRLVSLPTVRMMEPGTYRVRIQLRDSEGKPLTELVSSPFRIVGLIS